MSLRPQCGYREWPIDINTNLLAFTATGYMCIIYYYQNLRKYKWMAIREYTNPASTNSYLKLKGNG